MVKTENLQAFLENQGLTQAALALRINEYARKKGKRFNADGNRVSKFMTNRPGGMSTMMIAGTARSMGIKVKGIPKSAQ